MTRGRDVIAGKRMYLGAAIRLRDVIVRERLFAAFVGAGIVLRIVAMIGFYPVFWYNDSFEYLGVARRWQAYPIRPDGYSALLYVLRPFHSLGLIAALQHLMGLAVAVMLYALMRRFGVRRWIAAVVSLPQLLDTHQIVLEQMVLSDTLFTFLIALAVVGVSWHRTLSARGAGMVGAALAAASLTRTVGLPVVILVLIVLLLWRCGWRPIVAFVVVVAVGLIGYASWFDHEHGRFSTTSADGIFLYARIADFAQCDVIKPKPPVSLLCDPRPPSRRPPGPYSIWHRSPLDNVDGQHPSVPALRFTNDRNHLALQFALGAIRAQPLSYVRASFKDVLRGFKWNWDKYPNSGEAARYDFSNDPWGVPRHVFVLGDTALGDATAYEQGDPHTRVMKPWSSFLEQYGRVVWLRGPLLLVLFVLGAIGLAVRWRDRRRGVLAFVWATAVALLLLPDFLAQFDHRYVMPALPIAAAAAGLAVEMIVRPERASSVESPDAPADLNVPADSHAPAT